MQKFAPTLVKLGVNFLTFLSILALLLSFTFAARAQTPEELPPLNGYEFSVARAINTAGEVAGISFNSPPFEPIAVVWDLDGTPWELPPLDGHDFSEARGINIYGEVIGVSYDLISMTTAVVWNRDGLPRPLMPAGDDLYGVAFGINDRGEVVGRSYGGSQPFNRAVIWDSEGTPEVLDTLGANCISALARAISNSGEVTGSNSCQGVGSTAVRWDRFGTPLELPPPTNDPLAIVSITGISINEKGFVAGDYALNCCGSGGFSAAIWDKRGDPRKLLPLAPDITSQIGGINARGVAVGRSDQKAVTWARNGMPEALPIPSGFSLTAGNAISDRGEVAGQAAGGVRRTTRAIVWRK